MYHFRTNHIYGYVVMDEGSKVIRDDVEEGFVCVLQFVCSVWEGVGGVKGTHAQTRLSLGTVVAYSSPLFNCQGRRQRLGTIASEPFIMGQFVVVLQSTAINTTHHHLYSYSRWVAPKWRKGNCQIVI